ncbi:hypothetical protein H8E52_00360 [bacterium]|nr:hypothetical protein [bacterium]
MINGDTLIGDVFKIKAGADTVIRKFMGEGCFTCPAVTTEPLKMGAVMHGLKLDDLLAELNALPDGVTDVKIGAPERKGSFLANLLGKKTD